MATLARQPTEPAPLPEDDDGRGQTLRAFRSRAFTLLWLNTFLFFMVQGIQRFAFVWLVLDISNDRSGAAGIVTFALGIPVLFIALPAGVLSDRMNRQRLLSVSQGAAAMVMALMAVLVFTDVMSLSIAVVMAMATGACVAVAQPVRASILPSIVEKPRLMNAIVLTTIGMNTSMIIGPVLGGVAIHFWGIGGAFAVQAAILGLAWLVIIPFKVPAAVSSATGRRHPIQDFKDGISFVVGHRPIALLILLLVMSGMLMMGPSGALIPQIAKEELGAGPFAASALFVFVGIGMMGTSFLLASRRDMANKGGFFIGSLIAGGIIFASFGLSTEYALTALFMLFWGISGGFFMNLNQTLIQSNTPLDLMGRVMSIHTLAFMGITPMGALGAGFMADVVGAPTWVAISGFTLTGIAIIVLLTQPKLRRMA